MHTIVTRKQQRTLMSVKFVGEWFASMALTPSETESHASLTGVAGVTVRRSADGNFGVEYDHDG